MAEGIFKMLRNDENIKNFQKLLKKPEVKDNLNLQHGEKQTTFLHEACKHGHDKIVKHLIEKGAELEIRASNGWTPLHKAAAWCHVECVQVLIESGANVNSETEGGNTPLHLVSQNTAYIYHRDILKKKDTDKIQKQNYKNCFDIVKILLSAGANVNAKNYLGRTPLHNATVQGHLHAVALLIDKEADVNIKDHRKKTAIDVARDNKQYHVVEWFKEYEIHEERLARQDLARFASSEHSRLEKRLLELAEEHEGELAEQRAQLLQAYRLDQENLQATHEEAMKEELAKKEAVIVQLNSLVKAERQNMDNDYMTYHKQVIHLQQVLQDMNIEKHGHLKYIQELEVQVQESESKSRDQEASISEMSTDIQQLQEEKERESEEHKVLIDTMVADHKEKLLLLQKTCDSLQLEFTNQKEVTEEKQKNVEQLEEQLRSLQSESLNIQQTLETKEQEKNVVLKDLETQRSEVEVKSVECIGLKDELSSAKQKHQEVQIHFQQVLTQKETELAKLNEDNTKYIEQVGEFNNQEEVLKQTQATLQKLTEENKSLKEKNQHEIDTINLKHAAMTEKYVKDIENFKNEKQSMEQQYQELSEKQRLEKDTLVKNNEESLAKNESLLAEQKVEKDILVQKYEESMQKLKSDTVMIQRKHQESVQKIEAEKTATEQGYKEEILMLQTDNKKKLAEFQQKITEKDKELIIATTQLKHQTETIKSYETTQHQQKQKHQADLKQLEARLAAEHQAVINKFKEDMTNQHREEVVQIEKCLKEQHGAELEQREVEIRDQNKRELAKIQQEFANKQSSLQQEMFRIAGAEQNKLKQQHVSQMEKIEATHNTEIQALKQKLKEENDRLLQHETLVQSTKQEISAQNQQHQEELNKMSSQYQQQLNKIKQDLIAKESELLDARNEMKELNLKINDLDVKHSQRISDMDQKVKSLQEEHSQEVAEFQRRESQMADKHRTEMKEVEERVTERQQLQQVNEEELSAKISELKKQDEIIKSYVRENTELKDKYNEEIAELQTKVEQLAKCKTEASEREEKYKLLKHDENKGEEGGQLEETLCNGHSNSLSENKPNKETDINGGNCEEEVNSDGDLIDI